ncbi:unnamed protein product, partial [Discosporangium mesarthrocarpum]
RRQDLFAVFRERREELKRQRHGSLKRQGKPQARDGNNLLAHLLARADKSKNDGLTSQATATGEGGGGKGNDPMALLCLGHQSPALQCLHHSATRAKSSSGRGGEFSGGKRDGGVEAPKNVEEIEEETSNQSDSDLSEWASAGSGEFQALLDSVERENICLWDLQSPLSSIPGTAVPGSDFSAYELDHHSINHPGR